MRMMMAETKCKFCGAKVVARWEEWSDQSAVDKFSPMLACNPCADARRKKNDSENEIISQCFGYSRLNADSKGKSVANLRQKLLLLTRAYAEGIAYIDNLKEVMWTEDFADLLIQKPDRASAILHEYRRKLPTT